jgi:Caspase domain
MPISRAHLLYVLSFATFLSSCANMDLGALNPTRAIADTFAVKVPFFIHAGNREAASYRTLQVQSTENMRTITHSIEASLVTLTINETKYYERIGVTPDETRGSESAALDLARRNALSGLLMIGSARSDITTRNSTETRINCSDSNKKFSCPKQNTYTTQVSCTTRVATASIPVRMIDVKSNKLIYSSLANGINEEKWCSDSTTSASSDQLFREQAVGFSVRKIIQDISPREALTPLDMMSADKTVNGKNLAEFDKAYSFAKAKRLDKGCEMFAEINRGVTESVALTYNLGFCAESRGEMDIANDFYERASQLNGGVDSQIDRRQIAIRKFLQANPAYASQSTFQQASFAPASGQNKALQKITGRKVALVVGNGKYEHSWLANPENDARAVASQLDRIGFKVTKRENVRSTGLNSMINSFVESAKGASLAIIYFSGHGVQLNGENYLVPVDNESIKTADDLRKKALSLGQVMGTLDAMGIPARIVIIDACRNNPYPSEQKSAQGTGLAAVKTPPQGGLVAFSASPGQTASDNQSANNSLYTKLLVESLRTVDLPIEEVFKSVREKMKAAGTTQIPSEVSSITGSFAINSK